MGIQDEKARGPAGSGRRVAWPLQSLDAPRLQACPQSQAGFAAPPLVRTMWAQHSQGATDPELSAQAEAEGKSCCWSLFEVWRKFRLRNRVALPSCGGKKGAEASY